MAGYIKKIALIKTLKAGYSADGGELKGLVRCECYGGFFKAEASLINFAPLTEGAFRLGISDGERAVIFDPPSYESECEFNLSKGFACLICFCRSESITPVACAVSGDNQYLLASLEDAMKRDGGEKQPRYDDEAIAEVNYYELESDEAGAAVREDKESEEGDAACKDEEAEGAGEETFFERMKGDIDKIFKTYAREERLEGAIDGSRWAKITYGTNNHYAFGVVYCGGKPKYLGYAVPVNRGGDCPESLRGRAVYAEVEGGAYWILYQDASTGVSLNA